MAKDALPKRCRACGKNDHQRASSKKCPKRVVRPGKEKLQTDDPTKSVKRTFSVYKQGLRTFCKKGETGVKLEEACQLQVRNATINSFYGTRLLNLHLQLLVESHSTIPDVLDSSWLRQFFTRRVTDKDLEETLKSFPDFEYAEDVDGQIVTYLVKDYIVNFELHLKNQWLNLSKRYKRHELNEKGVLERKEVNKRMAEIVWEVPENADQKIREIYHLNFIFSTVGGKQFNLAPQYTPRAKYITIDTDALHSLTNSEGDKREGDKSEGDKSEGDKSEGQ